MASSQKDVRFFTYSFEITSQNRDIVQNQLIFCFILLMFCITLLTFTRSKSCCVTSSAAANWHHATDVKETTMIYINQGFWHCEEVRKGPKWLPRTRSHSERPAVSNCMAGLAFSFLTWHFQCNPFFPTSPCQKQNTRDESGLPHPGCTSKSLGNNVTAF